MLRLMLSILVLGSAAARAVASDWPQWRGPDRNNVSAETGLRATWPPEGPSLVWQAGELGDGVSPVSVAGGRVFATGNVGTEVICVALSEMNGKRLWQARLGIAAKEMSIMRWLAQMAPTADAERVYAVTAHGDYVCLSADTGKELWRKHFASDFVGEQGYPWGYCDYPMVDGERLIVCPGGSENTIAALDKKTGRIVWSCSIPGEAASHSVLIAAQLGGVRQYIVHLWQNLYGISTEGKVLWKYAGLTNTYAITHAPVASRDEVFFANGYGAGHVLLKIGKKGESWSAEAAYRKRNGAYLPWLGSPTAVGEHLLINTSKGITCLNWKTGKALWEETKLGRCTYTVADGKVFIRTQDGLMVLATVDPQEYRPLAEFTPPRPDKGEPAWTFPVVANGQLYVRDYDKLLCYDIHAPQRSRKKVPGAVFVPTPADVVTKMLELAGVKEGDVVYDLGSGDGRIVLTAANSFGCKAIGVELNEELVKLSRQRARAAGAEKLVTFEHADLFEADFSAASVVTLYILPAMSQKLIPKLAKLKPGSRLVSHAFPIPGLVPERVIRVTSQEDDVERPVYLYTVPLKRGSK
jgi:outer membrane protein assembly factor BamB